MGSGMEIGVEISHPRGRTEIHRISEQHLGIIIVIITVMFPTIMIITGTVIIIIILIT